MPISEKTTEMNRRSEASFGKSVAPAFDRAIALQVGGLVRTWVMPPRRTDCWKSVAIALWPRRALQGLR